MCYHTEQTKEAEAVEKKFKATIKERDLFTSSNHYNGFAYPKTPVITNENPQQIQMIQWGLVPHWAKPDWNRNFTLNAKLETLSEKPSFRNIIQNRCLIIVDGFFEWQHIGKQKNKFEIGFQGELFALGGLYDTNNGEPTYTIVTTAAQGIMREIHNTKMRMPIALKDENAMKQWLEGEEEVYSWDFSTELKI